MQAIFCALILALVKAGSSIAARIPIMAITTNNSISVNPLRPQRFPEGRNASAAPWFAVTRMKSSLSKANVLAILAILSECFEPSSNSTGLCTEKEASTQRADASFVCSTLVLLHSRPEEALSGHAECVRNRDRAASARVGEERRPGGVQEAVLVLGNVLRSNFCREGDDEIGADRFIGHVGIHGHGQRRCRAARE